MTNRLTQWPGWLQPRSDKGRHPGCPRLTGGVDTSDPGPSQCDGPVTRRGLVRPHCATFEDKMQTRLRADTQPITDSPSKCKLRLYSHCKAVLLLHHNQWPWMEELTSKWHNQGLYSLSHFVAGLDLQFIIAIRCKKLVHPRTWF